MGVKLVERALAQLDEATRVRVVKWRWFDRLVSLWAPVTVLALIFAVYLIIVESAVCSYLWLQPVMQGVGLLCFGWWLALLGLRTPPAKKWNQPRLARYAAEEVVSEAHVLLKKGGAKVKSGEADAVIAATAAVFSSYGQSTAEINRAAGTLLKVVEKELKRFRGGMLDAGGGFVKALAIALAFRAVLLDPFKIPSGSMLPTLELGDQIFVNKFIYGVRLPFTNYVPFVIVREPAKGDVIVFNNPVDPSVDYVKRVVGTPGDVLTFSEAGLAVNGGALGGKRGLRHLGAPGGDHHQPRHGALLVQHLVHRRLEPSRGRAVPRAFRGLAAAADHRHARAPAAHADDSGRPRGEGAAGPRVRHGRQPQQLV